MTGRVIPSVPDAFTIERYQDEDEPCFVYDSLHEWHPELQQQQQELHHSALVIQPVWGAETAVSCMVSTTANGAYETPIAVEVNRLLKTLS
ncbi:hypothetical protein QJS77_14500, partial [Enterococcus faecium]